MEKTILTAFARISTYGLFLPFFTVERKLQARLNEKKVFTFVPHPVALWKEKVLNQDFIR